jgi:hypothetical protein
MPPHSQQQYQIQQSHLLHHKAETTSHVAHSDVQGLAQSRRAPAARPNMPEPGRALRVGFAGPAARPEVYEAWAGPSSHGLEHL